MKICPECQQRFAAENWECPGCGGSPPRSAGVVCCASGVNRADADFPQEAFESLAAIEQSHFWFQSRNELIVWALGKYFPGLRNFLEIGCGTGNVLRALKQRWPSLVTVGGEIHAAGLAFARERLPETELLQLDARELPFTSHFDVIGAFDVIEHIDEDEQVLRRMFEAVVPGGGVLLTVPQHPALWSEVDEFSCHKRRYRKDELLAKLVTAGFEVVLVNSFVSLLFPVLLLKRLFPRRGRPVSTVAELAISPRLNSVFGAVMKAERRLIARGVGLPFGGSLLVVARRP